MAIMSSCAGCGSDPAGDTVHLESGELRIHDCMGSYEGYVTGGGQVDADVERVERSTLVEGSAIQRAETQHFGSQIRRSL